ncbi:MAG: triose-phosphate isomerase [Hyphomicrobiaceae bacterium]|nr:triose-phosphate isomerase [Hyphomicrobiaceae bacterium]
MSETAPRPRPLIAGNWKMNGIRAALAEAMAIHEHVSANSAVIAADVMICPPATLILVMAEILKDGPIAIGGQDCHTADSGAHTGDISAMMLADAGARAVILGHSERRADHGETDRLVASKVEAAHRAGLSAIICVGETLGQRQAGQTLAVIARQLAGSLPATAPPHTTVIAYEPVWAIGTGLTPATADVAQVHAMMRAELISRFGEAGRAFRLLYGGSVKPSNAAELLAIADVDGALVGGASLKAEDFLGIVHACSPAART